MGINYGGKLNFFEAMRLAEGMRKGIFMGTKKGITTKPVEQRSEADIIRLALLLASEFENNRIAELETHDDLREIEQANINREAFRKLLTGRYRNEG